MPRISTEPLIALIVALAAVLAPAQEEKAAGRPELDTNSLLAGLDDPDAIARPLPFAARAEAVTSRPQRGEDDRPEGAFVHEGRVYPLGRERFENRDEVVLARLDGKGAVIRIWMERPLGRLRLRRKGLEQPLLDLDTASARDGFVRLFAPPLGNRLGEGFEILRPLPFAGEALLTCDEPAGHVLIDLLRVSDEITVRDFDLDAAIGGSFAFGESLAALLERAGPEAPLAAAPGRALVIPAPDAELVLEAGRTATIFRASAEDGPRALDAIVLETLAPFAAVDPLDRLVLRLVVDGEPGLEAPLDLLLGGGAFAARSSIHLKIGEPLPGRIRRRSLRLPQPFARSLEVELENRGESPSPNLRFRFPLREAAPDVVGRLLVARICEPGRGSIGFPRRATHVAESLLVADLAGDPARDRPVLMLGKEAFAGPFGHAASGPGYACFHARLLDRCELEPGELMIDPGRLGRGRALLLAYLDSGRER